MKRLTVQFGLIVIFALVILSCKSSDTSSSNVTQELKSMTFNVRYGSADDGANSWQFRKNYVFETVRSFSPDILGVQEALKFQMDELLENLPEYNFVGVGRDDGIDKGEFSALLFNKQRFIVDSSGTFWFSDSPTIPGSKTWGNNFTRICSWAILFDKFFQKKLLVCNLHLDHESQNSREKSAVQLVEFTDDFISRMPVIVMGDFNSSYNNETIKTILRNGFTDTYRDLNNISPNEGTFNGFEGIGSGEKIDFIFSNSFFETISAAIVKKSFNGMYPSDHFPVTAVVKYSK
ncbi:MAG: endonuclease/exonuclease/phosphatase family protein [Ignavibacteria bacterium]|jgi:endonuclease/exonuclease/phosphatase family metal-dependent hydrolase|nr:endonuclease/exonuclease/phosphatase family protein [Ignavibacteria bacterium]